MARATAQRAQHRLVTGHWAEHAPVPSDRLRGAVRNGRSGDYRGRDRHLHGRTEEACGAAQRDGFQTALRHLLRPPIPPGVPQADVYHLCFLRAGQGARDAGG